MPWVGKTLMAREIAALVDAHWNDGILKATAVALAESRGSLGAYHDNLSPTGEIMSRDCGLFQINISASKVGTDEEAGLRTESLDPEVYKVVAAESTRRAYKLYANPWIRDGQKDIRKWQPWVAYTLGWAMFPEWWVWARPDLDHWAPTGRYLQLAIRGVANYKLLTLKLPAADCLLWAQGMANKYQVPGTLSYDPKKFIWWSSIPKKPLLPPSDGIGPRPVPNNGV